jgi:hypothetical protein
MFLNPDNWAEGVGWEAWEKLSFMVDVPAATQGAGSGVGAAGRQQMGQNRWPAKQT